MRTLTWIRVLLMLTVVLPAAAQPPGVLSGTVTREDGTPLPGVTVRADGYFLPYHAAAQTNGSGSFLFTGLADGAYGLTAWRIEEGFAFSSQTVSPNETTNVTIELTVPVADDLELCYLQGNAIIEPPTGDHPLPAYFIDLNADQAGDFRLCFGPPWYDEPQVDRPPHGGAVAVLGGLLSYGAAPMVVVYELYDAVWRTPTVGHGGYGGDRPFISLVCHDLESSGTGGLDEPERVELRGVGVFDLCGPDTITPPGVYEFTTDPETLEITHHLNFGMCREVPFNLADTLFVVGGRVGSPDNPAPWVIVYEVDGVFWREPGDTTCLAPMTGQNTSDPILLPPSSFVLASFPNPLNASTTLSFTLPRTGEVTLRMYDILGQTAATLVSGRLEAGSHAVTWNADGMPSGVYFVRLEALSGAVTQKLVILK